MDQRIPDWGIKATFAIAFVVVSLFVLQRAGLYLPVHITTSSVSSELSVVGEGKVDVVPDTAYVDVGVSFDSANTAPEAQTRLSDQNNKIVAAMKTLGIAEENIKTTNYSVSPNYVYEGGKSRQNGFVANSTITIKTDKIDLAGKIIETATSAGATQVGSARFVVDKPENYREQAREKAINNAKDQAQKLATSLGITLGKVTNIVESTPQTPPMLYAEKAIGLGAGGGAPSTPNLQPGQETITSTVTLYFEKR